MKRMQRSGSLLLFAGVGAAAYFFLAPRFPKDQTVNVVLGDAARDVTEVSVRYGAHDTEWSKGATMHYDLGKAPRVVNHETRLPDGDYLVAIEVRSARGVSITERRVDLRGGGSTSIDVSREAPK